METVLDDESIRIINDAETIKVIATVNDFAVPHVVFKDLLYANEDGMLVLCELIETSVTNENLVRSIWFGKKVVMNFQDKNKKSLMVEGIPVQAIVSGKEFQKYYIAIRRIYGNVDVSTIWIIKPICLQEKTLKKRIHEEEELHPMITHLDRIVHD